MAEPRFLDEWPSYASFSKKKQFWQKYYRPLALGPFAVAIFVGIRFLDDSHYQLGVDLVFASLAWAGFVIFYSLSFMVRAISMKCPRCGWRYGMAEECGSCGLPRHAPPSRSEVEGDILNLSS
jgi:hypothetical protein